MADKIVGSIRRIDFEPKKDFLGFRTYAHVFVDPKDQKEQVDVYTDDPRFEAALLAAYAPPDPTRPPAAPIVEVHYEEVGEVRKVTRVVLDREREADDASCHGW